MKLEIQIPDDVYALYKRYMTRVRSTPEAVIEHQLERFAGFSPAERWLFVSPEDRVVIEHALGGVSLSNADALVRRLKARASVYIGKVQVQLTTAQLAEIQRRAEKNHRDPTEEVQRILQEIMRDFTEAI